MNGEEEIQQEICETSHEVTLDLVETLKQTTIYSTAEFIIDEKEQQVIEVNGHQTDGDENNDNNGNNLDAPQIEEVMLVVEDNAEQSVSEDHQYETSKPITAVAMPLPFANQLCTNDHDDENDEQSSVGSSLKQVTSYHTGVNLNLSPTGSDLKANSNTSLGSFLLGPNQSWTRVNTSGSNNHLPRKRLTLDDVKININEEQLHDFREIMMDAFRKADLNGNGYIELSELREALKSVGIDIPGYQVRVLEDEFKKNDRNKDGKLSLDEFEKVYTKLKSEKEERTFKKTIKPIEKSITIKSNSDTSIVHTVKHSEQWAFTKWINQNLANDPDLNLEANPINPETNDLYKRCKDGIVICKLINFSVPNTIDERSINKAKNIKIYQELENLELALRSAEAIGCHVINIRPHDIRDEKEHLILGILWQIIQIGLFAEINLTHHPGLVLLLNDGESKEDLLKLTKEELLCRWVNYHLARAGTDKRVKNFSTDIKDSVAYVHLLKQISPANQQPAVSLNPLNEKDALKRAELMLQEAEKLKAREFITAQDVIDGKQTLNMAFVANLFNTYPALDAPEDIVNQDDLVEETREEKTFRNWMNSMGVKPYVNYLYTDLQDCLVIFQLYDMIKPGSVEWKRVVQEFTPLKAKFQKLDNCNYAVDIGKKQMNFILVGIQGSNILDGDKTYTLALIWQLMRAYTLAMLAKIAGQGHPVVENGIIEWTNNKLKSAGKKTFIQNFQDPVISDSRVLCDLIDSIKPGSISYDLLKSDNTHEAKMDNARYAVSIARKIGARVFALPEDIVEGKHKMIMTIFATLMIKDYQPQQKTLDQ